ncbi:SprT family zinc-dependent metalloprotease [Zobellella iuensis]|uniref:SprT family zinc-dependent metalloprotease n=1 Tax=Zobellella iuensis TaxID=2803811 RepID=A0ABS1QTL5_9GAMM|nr:SprT family zinc-dependent metalloprotease [Zobellella iuensis]MBL1378204.1 SprT family zinc-dependent metalloprotease [Zobellella iuensis]
MSQPSDALCQQVRDKVSQCLALAGQRLGRDFPPPRVRFDQRGRIAGSAWLERGELRFNPVLLADNAADFLTEIVPHEVAHLVVFHRFGKVRPHGAEWQAVMREVFGLEPRTRHRLNTAKVAPTFSYDCGCRLHQLSLRRHNSILRGKQRYLCMHCGQLLKPHTPTRRKTP